MSDRVPSVSDSMLEADKGYEDLKEEKPEQVIEENNTIYLFPVVTVILIVILVMMILCSRGQSKSSKIVASIIGFTSIIFTCYSSPTAVTYLKTKIYPATNK